MPFRKTERVSLDIAAAWRNSAPSLFAFLLFFAGLLGNSPPKTTCCFSEFKHLSANNLPYFVG
jgi:hypothetical protein